MKPIRNETKKKSREFAESVIDRAGFFTLATVDAEGMPYCIPLSMARDGEWLYFHCAREGHKIDNLRFSGREGGRVCVSCVGDYRIPPKSFTVDYESAVVFGTAVEVFDRDEKIRALELICRRYSADNMAAFESTAEKSLEKTGVWKIHIDEISGKGSPGR